MNRKDLPSWFHAFSWVSVDRKTRNEEKLGDSKLSQVLLEWSEVSTQKRPVNDLFLKNWANLKRWSSFFIIVMDIYHISLRIPYHIIWYGILKDSKKIYSSEHLCRIASGMVQICSKASLHSGSLEYLFLRNLKCVDKSSTMLKIFSIVYDFYRVYRISQEQIFWKTTVDWWRDASVCCYNGQEKDEKYWIYIFFNASTKKDLKISYFCFCFRESVVRFKYGEKIFLERKNFKSNVPPKMHEIFCPTNIVPA